MVGRSRASITVTIMKVIKPVVSSVHICIFYIICECMSGAGSARNVQIDDRPGSNVGDIIHRSSQSGRDKLLDDSLIPSDASYDSHSYADCKGKSVYIL